MFIVPSPVVSNKMRLWCRNCNELNLHKKIGVERLGWKSPNASKCQKIFRCDRKLPLYACGICGCQVAVMKQW